MRLLLLWITPFFCRRPFLTIFLNSPSSFGQLGIISRWILLVFAIRIIIECAPHCRSHGHHTLARWCDNKSGISLFSAFLVIGFGFESPLVRLSDRIRRRNWGEKKKKKKLALNVSIGVNCCSLIFTGNCLRLPISADDRCCSFTTTATTSLAMC